MPREGLGNQRLAGIRGAVVHDTKILIHRGLLQEQDHNYSKAPGP